MNKILKLKNGVPIKSYKTIYEVQKKEGYARGHISECLNGKRKTAYGYEWEYLPKIKGKWKYWFKSKKETIKDIGFLADMCEKYEKEPARCACQVNNSLKRSTACELPGKNLNNENRPMWENSP